jgi:hypothetical protein
MDGGANLEEHTINAPSGTYRAVALRSYDPKTSQWSIWWLDGRSPHGQLDPPVQGRFEKGIGTFYGHTTINGKPMRVRFVWSQITAASRIGNKPVRQTQETPGKRTGPWNSDAPCEL